MPERITSDECKTLHARAIQDRNDATSAAKKRAMHKLAEALGKAAAVLVAEETTDALKV